MTDTQDTYRPADTEWLADCRFGISVTWTARTAPQSGPQLSFQEAVRRFDVNRFLDSVAASGADYLLFTATHALQMLPAPHAVVDRLLPGRTCRRDLIAELASGAANRGLHFLLYYNHSCNGKDDPEWREAVGYNNGPGLDPFAERILEIVLVMGQRYGPAVKAWWFDSSYSVDNRGPLCFTSTDLGTWRYPWQRHTAAAKAGYPDRLVTYNAGIGETFLYTTHQDYWAGEMAELDRPPSGRFLSGSGLQWHGWTTLDTPHWVHTEPDADIPPPRFPDDELATFLAQCRRCRCPMTFNVGIYQDGTMAEASLQQLRRLAGT